MTMRITHPDAPGHDAIATEDGWSCSCGAGNTWKEGPRPRARGAGGARRHLTAAARNNPVRHLGPDPFLHPESDPDEARRNERAAAARRRRQESKDEEAAEIAAARDDDAAKARQREAQEAAEAVRQQRKPFTPGVS
jgi:hypothetical protein